jgi:hypothetical protein
MCFVLYAGTIKPLSRREWRKGATELSVKSLTDRDVSIRAHFKMPEVQYIGSTSGCGCDFPHVTFDYGEWVDVALAQQRADKDRLTTENSNRSALVNLFKSTDESIVEAYGVWDGDFLEGPRASEVVTLDQILDSNFYFKERGFYRIEISTHKDSTRSH